MLPTFLLLLAVPMSWAYGSLALFGLSLAYIWYRSARSAPNFFQLNGIPHKAPASFLGNYGPVLLRRINFYDFVKNYYREFAGSQVFGLFQMSRPVLVIRDLQLIKRVLIKDFDHFVDRPHHVPMPSIEPMLYESLFMLEGEKWRTMRSTLSPAFTGAKLRHMFQLVVECADRTVAVLQQKAAASAAEPWVPELKQLFSYFANDVIATAAFGIEVNSVADNQNQFYVLAKKSLDVTSFKLIARMTLAGLTQSVSKRFGTRGFTADVVRFFDSIVHDTIASRDRDGIERPDMIQLLMQARDGQLSADADAATTTKPKWTRDDITAQCYLFFLAGFETISTALSNVCQELVENPAVQRRLRDECDALAAQMAEVGQTSLAFDDLAQLKYMDMVIAETTRKYPTPFLDREARTDYPMRLADGRVVVVPKGTSILIPTIGIHHDAEYFPDPQRFDPERFSEANRPNIDTMAFMPFGLGPRSCIGMRMAQMELKAFLFVFLRRFELLRHETTQIPLRFGRGGFGLLPERGINVHLKPRNEQQ